MIKPAQTIYRHILMIALASAYIALPAAAQTARSGEIAPDFRGKIIYKGIYSGSTGKTGRNGTESTPVEGAFTLTVNFDGAAIKARAETTGRLRFSAPISGLVTNGVCKLYGPNLIEGPCNFSQFSGDSSWQKGNKSLQYRLDGKAVAVEDFAARDAQLAIRAAESRKRAEVERADELAARAKLRAALPTGAVTKYKPLLERAVTADSSRWFSNRFADGSIDLVAVRNDSPSGSVFLKAYFNYAGGGEGWVGAVVKGGKVECLQFWDDSSGCRGVGSGANAQLANGFLSEMIRGGGSSSSGGRSSSGECNDACQFDRNIRNSAKDSERQQAEADARRRAAGEAQQRALENRDAIGR